DAAERVFSVQFSAFSGGYWLAVFPVFRIDHLGDTGLEDGGRVASHFRQHIVSIDCRASVQDDYGVARGAGAAKEIQNQAVVSRRLFDEFRRQGRGLGGWK